MTRGGRRGGYFWGRTFLGEDIFGGGHVERLLFGASAGYPWFGKVPRFTIIFVVEEYLKVSSTGTYLVKRSPNCKDIVEDFISFGEDIV